MRTTASLEHGTYELTFEVTPSEPDVGIMSEGVEISAIADADGNDVQVDDVAAREGLSYDDAEAALVRACEERAEAGRYDDDDDREPDVSDEGFDPYAGCYTGDC